MFLAFFSEKMSFRQVVHNLHAGRFLFTSESVTEGHPDKIADQISDAILDACLCQDRNSIVSVDAATKTGVVLLLGEITTNSIVDCDTIARDTVKQIGYDAENKGLDYQRMDVVNSIEMISSFSPPSSTQVPKSLLTGQVFGYATNETPELMPLSHMFATQLCKKLTEVRRNGMCPWARPDGKAQVTMEYGVGLDNSLMPLRVHTLVISIQHVSDTPIDHIRSDVLEYVVKPVIKSPFLDEETVYLINPSGRFVVGGPQADAGLTGRQSIIDTYGGWGSYGGGVLSGRDASKFQRTTLYVMRWVAKSLVKAGLAGRCLVQVSYVQGQLASLHVDSYGSAKFGLSNEALCNIIKRNFDLTPGALVNEFGLCSPGFKRDRKSVV